VKPEKLCGDLWEEPREKDGLQLVTEMGKGLADWKLVLKDDSRRSYAAYLPKALSVEQCSHYFETIRDNTNWMQPEGRLGPIPRKTAWMTRKGCQCSYRYGGIEVDPIEYPPWMIELLQFVMPKCGFGTDAEWPDSCNMNLYEDGGMSVGWHSDDERLFQGKFRDIIIISLSLGTKRKFELRLNWPDEGERPVQRVMLDNGDLMTMEGMLQKHFMHRVPKEENITSPRINLTWRWVVMHTPKCPVRRERREGRPVPRYIKPPEVPAADEAPAGPATEEVFAKSMPTSSALPMSRLAMGMPAPKLGSTCKAGAPAPPPPKSAPMPKAPAQQLAAALAATLLTPGDPPMDHPEGAELSPTMPTAPAGWS